MAVWGWFAADGGGGVSVAPVGPSSGDVLTLLDASKLNASNLNTGQGTMYTAAHVLGAGERAVVLDVFLVEAARRRAVSWTVDGQTASDGRLVVDREPPENHVAVHRVVVAEGNGVRAEFTLVVIPSSTSRRFQEWLRTEKGSMDWTRSLPPVYSSLLPGGVNPEPEGCVPRAWPVLRKVRSQYHPGAVYEMRSAIRADGSGHQATYDARGQLIREGLGAGSADRASPRQYNPFRLMAHRDRDVLPFVWAAQLDGNPVNPKLLYSDFDAPLVHLGEHLRGYMSVRPTFSPVRAEVPAGVCVDGQAPAGD